MANIDFGKHHFAPSAQRGRGRPDPGAEAAASHLDEAISSDRWLLCAPAAGRSQMKVKFALRPCEAGHALA